jgi:3-dehydro-L-gulonate 2-dehydrogenase
MSYTVIQVMPAAMLAEFTRILQDHGFTKEKAFQCAKIFTDSSTDGIYTHGVNRFPRFVEYLKKGYVKPGAEPGFKHRSGNIEQWDGNLGPGPLNAMAATERVMQLAAETGIACIGLANTNHWMRGGTYGWQAAKKGFVFIGFTNTIANMPAWGAIDQKLGNNPLVIAIPYQDEAIVLDMAMSQYSFGAMENAVLKKESLAVNGGFDRHGHLTQDPAAIIESSRPLAIGFWKGSGLALLLDILTVLLSGGLATHEISRKEAEYAVSQVFIAIDISKLGDRPVLTTLIKNIIDDYSQSAGADDQTRIVYPGQRVLETRKQNLDKGIPVLKEIWEKIKAL